jgi:hypothetical protein
MVAKAMTREMRCICMVYQVYLQYLRFLHKAIRQASCSRLAGRGSGVRLCELHGHIDTSFGLEPVANG